MTNVQSVLDQIGIDHRVVSKAVQDAGRYVRDSSDPCYAAHNMFQEVLGTDLTFDDAVYAWVSCGKMIELVVKENCIIDNEQELVKQVLEYTKSFCEDHKRSYLWAVKEDEEPKKEKKVKEEKVVKEKVDTGPSKAEQARTLYNNYVLKATEPLGRDTFVQLLIDQAELTPQGAVTYTHTLIKKYGCPPGFIPPRKQRVRVVDHIQEISDTVE